MGYLDDVEEAKRNLAEQTKAYKTRVSEAQKAEKQAQNAYNKTLRDAEKALKACESSWDKPLATFAKLKLFADRVSGSGGTLSIVEGADARVDTSGNVYSTTDVSSKGGGVSLAGAVVGGALAGAPGAIIGGRKKTTVSTTSETHDERKLFVTVTTQSGQITEEGDASKEAEARTFAANVINQSKVAAAAVTQHREDVRRLSEAVETARVDTAAVEAARVATRAAIDDTSARDEAERRLEEVRASGTEEERAELEAKERKSRNIKRGGIGAAIAAVLVFFLFATHVICFHSWKEPTCTEPETCSACGRTRGEPLGHEWKQATCTEPETCDRCGDTKGEALGHDVTSWETVKKATCTHKGKREGACTRCGEIQTRTTKRKDHTFGDWATVKEATCTEEGVSKRTCTACGKEETKSIAMVDHTPGDWVVVKEATVTSTGAIDEGLRQQSCTVCGQLLDEETFTLELTMGQRNALAKAASYLSWTAFSYSGLIGQLEFEGFSTEDATFAADNCGADWNEQAAKKAESYLSWTSFSRDGLIDQLEFEGFTYDQAAYGASAVGY